MGFPSSLSSFRFGAPIRVPTFRATSTPRANAAAPAGPTPLFATFKNSSFSNANDERAHRSSAYAPKHPSTLCDRSRRLILGFTGFEDEDDGDDE